MRHLTVSAPVKAPAGFTVAFLGEYVRDQCGTEGKTLLPMRFTLTQLAGLTLERDVAVSVEYVLHDDAPADLKIRWNPDAAMFPSFDGTLSAQAAGETSCELTIAGTYDAPGGIAGQLFDAIVGVRIANATLERLLQQFGAAAEADYARRTAFS